MIFFFLSFCCSKIIIPNKSNVPEWSNIVIDSDKINGNDVVIEGGNFNVIINGKVNVKSLITDTMSTVTFTEGDSSFEFGLFSIKNFSNFQSSTKSVLIKEKVEMNAFSFSEIQKILEYGKGDELRLFLTEEIIGTDIERNFISFIVSISSIEAVSYRIDTSKMDSLWIDNYKSCFELCFHPSEKLRFIPNIKFICKEEPSIFLGAVMNNKDIYDRNFKKGIVESKNKVRIQCESIVDCTDLCLEVDKVQNEVILNCLHGNYNLYTSIDANNKAKDFILPGVVYSNKFIADKETGNLKINIHSSDLTNMNNSVYFRDLGSDIQNIEISSIDKQCHLELETGVPDITIHNVVLYIYGDKFINSIIADDKSIIVFMASNVTGNSLVCDGKLYNFNASSVSFSVISTSFQSFVNITKNITPNPNRVVNIDVYDYRQIPRDIIFGENGIFLSNSEASAILYYTNYKHFSLTVYNITEMFSTFISNEGTKSKTHDKTNEFKNMATNNWKINIMNWNKDEKVSLRIENAKVFTVDNKNLPHSFELENSTVGYNDPGRYCIIKTEFDVKHCPINCLHVFQDFGFIFGEEKEKEKFKAINILTKEDFEFYSYQVADRNVLISACDSRVPKAKLIIDKTSSKGPSSIILRGINLEFEGNETVYLNSLSFFQNSQLSATKHTLCIERDLYISLNILEQIKDRFEGNELNLFINAENKERSPTKLTMFEERTVILLDNNEEISLSNKRFKSLTVDEFSYSDREKPFIIDIEMPRFSVIDRGITIINLNNDNYYRIVGCTGQENYKFTDKGIIGFNGNKDKITLISSSPYIYPFLISSNIDEMKVELNYEGVYCIYETNDAKCPKEAQKVPLKNYKDALITKSYLNDRIDLYLDINKDSTFTISQNMLEKFNINVFGINADTKVDIEGSNKAKELVLTNISASIKNTAQFELLTVNSSKIKAEKCAISGKIQMHYKDAYLMEYVSKIDLSLIIDECQSLNFSSGSYNVDDYSFKVNQLISVKFILTEDKTMLNPLILDCFGEKESELVLIPTFQIISEKKCFIFITNEWKIRKITTKGNFVFVNKFNTKINIETDLKEIPSFFSFTNYELDNEEKDRICLCSEEDEERESKVYKIIKYKDGKEITKEELGLVKSSVYIVISTFITSVISLPDAFSGKKLVIDSQKNNCFVTAKFTSLNELIIKDVNITIDTNKLEVSKLFISPNSIVNINGTLSTNELTLSEGSSSILSKIVGQTNLTLDATGDISTLSLSDTNILLYYYHDTEENIFTLDIEKFNAINIKTVPNDLFIDYRGQENLQIPFFPTLNFREDSKNIKIVFSSNWDYTNVTAKRRGIIKANGNEIKYQSEYYDFPRDIIIIDKSVYTRRKGFYCIYDVFNPETKFNCDEEASIIDYLGGVIQEDLHTSEDNQISFVTTTDKVKISSKYLNAEKINLFGIKKHQIITICCDEEQKTFHCSLTVKDVDIELTNGIEIDNLEERNCFFDLSDNTKVVVAKILNGDIKDLSESKCKFVCHGTTILEHPGKSISLSESSLTFMNNYTFYYKDVKNVVVNLRSEEILRISADEKHIQTVPTLVQVSGIERIVFDDSLYEIKVAKERIGEIIYQSGKIHFYSNQQTKPQMFNIPQSGPNVYYHFKNISPETSTPTIPTHFITPNPTSETTVIEYDDDHSYLRMFLGVLIAADLISLIFLINYLYKKWISMEDDEKDNFSDLLEYNLQYL